MASKLTTIDPLLPLLDRAPLGIFSDIDGTVAPICDNPEDSRVTPRAKSAIERLISLGVRVALVTGRAVEKARQIAGIEGAYYAGNHGLNVYINGSLETPVAVRDFVPLAQQVLAEVAHLNVPGVIIEDKGPVLAFHYRMAEDEHAARRAILDAIGGSETARRFTVHHGRKVIELRPPLPVDKGTAVADLVKRMGIAATLCMGDDMTDVDMFRGVDLLRNEGIPGVNVAVWSEEGDARLLEVTDYYVGGVSGVEWLLEEVARALAERAQSGPGTASPART